MDTQVLLPDIDFAHAEAPDLHALIDSTREHGPVVHVRYHGQVAVLITSYRAVRAAFADEEHFASQAFYQVHVEPSQGRTLQAMAGDEHRRNRGLVSRSFVPRRVAGYVAGVITEEAVRSVEALAGNASVDLVERFARPFPFAVITRLLGLPVEDQTRIK